MRKTLLFLLIFSAKLAFGQLRDNFNDGNFTINPVWTGQTSLFTVNGSKQLNSLLSSVSQTVSLVSQNSLALNVKWEFSIQLNFDPSSTNLARIYLIADQADLKGSLNGYFIQIGESGGMDSYDLYKQTGNSVSKIVDGLPKNRVNINFLSTKLRVTRDDFGKWEVYTSVDDGASFNLEGSVTDKTFTSTNWFGVYCKYTPTRSDGFVFDDFIVEELVSDLIPPTLVSVKVVDEYTMEATFSEAVASPSSLMASNYMLKDLNLYPTSASATSLPHLVRLSFTQPFQSGNYTLIASGIGDVKGNTLLKSEASTFYIQPYTAVKGDVIINEIFADPSPSIGLPSVEFVELWNTSDKYILMKDWKYKDLTSTYTFLTDTIRPDEYVILCAIADVNLFKPYGKTIGLSTWPTLNNDKDRLSLINAQNTLIDEVFYTDNWYKDAIKKQGGYSLELIDPINRCAGIQNWLASTHSSGGTPGVENSNYRIQINSTPPKILAVSIIDETTIKIDFNKSIDSLSGALIDNYYLNNGSGAPLSAIPQSPDFISVLLKLSSALIKGQEYLLTVNHITDCAGNLIDQGANTAKLFKAKDIGRNDILISEILVNPKPGGVDFVEIYNNTDHILDLSSLKLATINAGGNIAGIKDISSQPIYIPGKTFWVLTSDVEIIKQHYEVKKPLQMTKMAALPSYTNEKGTVILLSNQSEIDRFDYHQKMHLPLLQIIKGVSLARVSFQRGANEKDNFKSSAQINGFATPTYKDAQENNINNDVWLENKVFSPDGDGMDDVLRINYQLADQDYLANVSVYNEQGLMVKRILKNSNIPKAGYLVWDGLNDRGNMNKVGIYVIKFEVFTLNGRSRHFEKTCVLATKLN